MECRDELLSELRALPAGTAESGGVLFGVHEGGVIRVVGHAQVPLEHVHGPSFVLSKRDEMAFRATMKPVNGAEPAGIYIVHRRPSSAVSEMDAAAAGKLFRDVPAVLLMVQRDGVVCYVQGAGEFVELSVSAPAREAEPEPRVRPRRTLWMAASGITVAGVAAAGWMWLRPANAPPPPAPVVPPVTAVAAPAPPPAPVVQAQTKRKAPAARKNRRSARARSRR